MRKTETIVAAALVVWLAPAALATNGTRFIGTGAHAVGRGGADLGVADDANALNTNPAGLAFIDGQRFDAMTIFGFPSASWSGPRDEYDSDTTVPLVGGSMAVAFDFDEPWLLAEALTFGDPPPPPLPSRLDPEYAASGLKLGIGVFPVAASKFDFRFTTPFWDEDTAAGLGRERVPYETDLKEVAVSVGLAYRINRYVSVGVAPSFIYSLFENDQALAQPVSILQGHPLTNDPQGPGELTYEDLSPVLGISQIEGFGDVDDASTFGGRVRAGIVINPTSWLRIGITYVSQTFKQDYLGEVGIDFERQIEKLDGIQLGGLLVGQTLKQVIYENLRDVVASPDDVAYSGRANARISPFDQPQEVGVGIGLFFESFMLALDVYWINWSSTFDEVTIRISDSTANGLNELTGDRRTTQHVVVPLEWDDQVVIAVGGAVRVTDWLVVRAGYNYGRAPTQSDTVEATVPAVLEHHITAGLSVYFRRMEVGLTAEWALTNSQEMRDHKGNASLDGHEIEVGAVVVGANFGLSF